MYLTTPKEKIEAPSGLSSHKVCNPLRCAPACSSCGSFRFFIIQDWQRPLGYQFGSLIIVAPECTAAFSMCAWITLPVLLREMIWD